MGIETLLGVGGSIAGGLLSSGAASDAADAQSAGTAASIAEQRRQYDLTRQDYAPYRAVGGNALNALAGYMGLPTGSPQYAGLTADQIRAQLTKQFTTPGAVTPTYGPNDDYDNGIGWANGIHIPQGFTQGAGTVDQAGLDAAVQQALAGQQQGGQTAPMTIDPTQDPGYQFGLQQGQQGLDRKIAASGGRVSGAALKAATRFNTDYATTGYNAAYQRGQDRLNRLAALAGIGQSATGSSAAAGAGATNAISSAMQNQGDNAGAARLAQGNIWGNTINQGVASYLQNSGAATGGNVYSPTNSANTNFGTATQNWW